MTGRQDLFDESMQLGHSAAWEQEWERALGFYRKALAEFPEDHDALSSLGLALVETGRKKEALAVYHKAAKADPSDPIPLEKCAEIFESLEQPKEAIHYRDKAADLYLRRRDVEKAIDNWTQIGRLSPANLPARTRLAMTNERLGRRRESVHEYLAIASILQNAGKMDRATEAVQRALTIVPGDAEATRAMKLLRAGDAMPSPAPPLGSTRPLRMGQARALLDAEIEPAEPVARSSNGLDAVQVADPEEAAQQQAISILAGLLFDEAESGEDKQTKAADFGSLARGITSKGESLSQSSMLRYLGQAINAQTRNNKEQAVKELLRAIDSGLNHPAAHYDLGYLYKELGKVDEAQQQYMEAIGHPELELGANLALGRLSRGKGDMTEAARFLVQALRIADTLSVDESKSSDLSQLYDSILATQSEGDDEALTQIVENALEFLSGPEWLQRVRHAREQLVDQGDGMDVVPIAQMLAVGGTDRVLSALQRIDELAREGMYVTAMEEAMLALEYSPSYLALHRRIAQLMLKTGRTESGLGKLATIAETHRVRGEINEASNMYTTVLKYSPVDINSRRKLIQLLTQQDKHDAVMSQYLELSDLYRQLAQIDQARETLAEAFAHVQRDQADREWALQILHKLGDIDIARLDWRKALQVFQRMRDIDPGNEDARTMIIDLNLRLGQEDQAAKELDSYLEYLVQAGRGGEALDLLEGLAREHPGKQALHSRLADAYRGAGRDADAIAQYDALGEIQLDGGDAQAAIRTIQTIVDMNPPDVEGYQELLRNLKAGQ